jgi:hypothetical protein
MGSNVVQNGFSGSLLVGFKWVQVLNFMNNFYVKTLLRRVSENYASVSICYGELEPSDTFDAA